MSDILSRLPSLEKRSILGGKNGTTLYQRSIEHRVIYDRVLKAFQCTKCSLHYFSSIHAGLMVKTLLRNFINKEKCPSELYMNTTDSVSSITNCSYIISVQYMQV